MTAHSIDEEIHMMEHPDSWPHSFVLPLTRPGQEGVGVLFQPSLETPAPAPEPVVYLGNMFDKGRVTEREQKRYPDFQALVDDGWRVD